MPTSGKAFVHVSFFWRTDLRELFFKISRQPAKIRHTIFARCKFSCKIEKLPGEKSEKAKV
jgi:hypothetical protein